MFYKVTYLLNGKNKIYKEYEIGYPCDVVSMLKEVEAVIEDESAGKDIILISIELLTSINSNNYAIVQNKGKVDMVHSPSHYKLRGLDIESVDVIRSVLSDEEYKGWCKGNALKYLFRAGKKDDEVQDLSKCSVYLKWLTDKLTNLCK